MRARQKRLVEYQAQWVIIAAGVAPAAAGATI